jgi:hypothetical protein
MFRRIALGLIFLGLVVVPGVAAKEPQQPKVLVVGMPAKVAVGTPITLWIDYLVNGTLCYCIPLDTPPGFLEFENLQSGRQVFVDAKQTLNGHELVVRVRLRAPGTWRVTFVDSSPQLLGLVRAVRRV